MSHTPNDLPTPGLPGAPGKLSGNALGVASLFIWAAGFPAAEELLDTWHPVALTAARFLMAMVLLMPLWVLADRCWLGTLPVARPSPAAPPGWQKGHPVRC